MEKHFESPSSGCASDQAMLQEEMELLTSEAIELESEKRIILGNVTDYLEIYGNFDDN
jgi:hypothetical protein